MPAVPDWREHRHIESFDVDSMGRLRPQTLLAWLLNSAWNHAKGTYYGYDELSSRKQMWVLVKMQIRIARLPLWGEEVTIETWGKRVERLYALRDFNVSSVGGTKAVSAASSWLVLDKHTGRPQRIEQKSDGFPWQPAKEEMQSDLGKVPELNHAGELARFRACFSDIDVNQHVNSTRYLQWMLDSHSHEFLKTRTPTSIELSFLSEALPDDEVTVLSETNADGELCCVKRTADGRELSRARIVWSRP